MITQTKRLMSNCALALVLAFLFTAPGAWASVTSGPLDLQILNAGVNRGGIIRIQFRR